MLVRPRSSFAVVVMGLACLCGCEAQPAAGQSVAGQPASGQTLPVLPQGQMPWLSPEQVTALVDSLPPPPAPDSAEDKSDLAAELDIQNTRTPERSRQAVRDAGDAATLMVGDVDPGLTPANSPALFALLDRAGRQANDADGVAKDRWKRQRPFAGHPGVVQPLFTAGGYSYPSGHTTIAFCEAVVLERIFPDRLAVIERDASRIAQSRVVAGVHYPSDIRTGEILGREVGQALLASPAFDQALETAKAETMPSGQRTQP